MPFASRHAQLVEKLVIVDGCARFSDVQVRAQHAAILAAAASDWETATEAIGATAFGSGREESRATAHTSAHVFGPEYFPLAGTFASVDVGTLLPTLSMPTAIVRHSGVRSITDAMTQELVSRTSDARLVTVNGL